MATSTPNNLQAPVVVTDDEHWSGFRPGLVSKHL